MSNNGHRHNPGSLKQQNKKHKHGVHRSKHQLNKFGKQNTTKVHHKIVVKSKKDRQNEKKTKILQNVRDSKDFLREVGFSQSHIPIAVISSSSFTCEHLVSAFQSDGNYEVRSDWINKNCRDYYLIESSRLKKKLLMMKMTQDSAYYFHDTIYASQAIWILMNESDSFAEMSALFQTFDSVHLPPIYHLIYFNTRDPKRVSTFMEKYSNSLGPFICDSDNIIQIHDSINIHKLTKCIPSFYMRPFSSTRPEKSRKNVNIISENIKYIDSETGGMLIVEGMLRGGCLSANDNVVIPGFGNFPIYQIQTSELENKNHDTKILSTRTKEFQLAEIDEGQYQTHDDTDHNMECEDILMRQDHQFFEPRELAPMDIDIPEYVQNWPDYKDNNESMSDSEVNDADESEGFDCSDSEESECEKYDTSNYFTSLQECLFYGQLCDNPNHRKIIQLQNYKAAFNRAIEYKEDDAVEAGQYVKIFIQNIPEFIYEYFWKFVGRLILYRLHPFEDQLSVVHYLIHKKDYTPDIFSNQKYLIFCGPRRFTATCVFSAPSNAKKACHKVIECVSGEAQVVVSLVGYLTFPNAEVTLFSQSSDGELTYIGGGHVLPISKRLLVNELVLTGSIRRAFKKTTIVKGIFHSREEASRFKEIEIFTENGGKGHMIKPIGTHGTIKCHFTLTTNKSQTVYGKLYKPQPLICDIETKVYLPSQHLL